jgi:hypothetical protein
MNYFLEKAVCIRNLKNLYRYQISDGSVFKKSSKI